MRKVERKEKKGGAKERGGDTYRRPRKGGSWRGRAKDRGSLKRECFHYRAAFHY